MTTDSQRNARGAQAERAGAPIGPADAWLGSVLVAGGVLAPAQLEQLSLEASAVWASVVAAGWATDHQIVEALARRFRLPVAHLATAEPRTVTLVPESLARKHRVVPVSATERTIQIATADPRDRRRWPNGWTSRTGPSARSSGCSADGLAARHRAHRTARRERGKSPGSWRTGLPGQAGADAAPGCSGAPRAQANQHLNGQAVAE